MISLSITRRTFVKAVGALAAMLAVSSKTNLLIKRRPAVAQTEETLLTCAADGGPFLAHVVEGRWVKSSPLKPNLTVAANAYIARGRAYSSDRIRYPMKRVDFDPSGSRNTQNRGKSGFIRITWDEALDLVANEFRRIKDTYGPGSACHVYMPHQWIGTLHSIGGVSMFYPPYESQSGWLSRFFALYGGCTTLVGGNSFPAHQAGGPLAWGMQGHTNINNFADVLQNSGLVIHWATDSAIKSYNTYRQNIALRQLKEKGVRQVVIDAFFNDTAAIYADKWIPVFPNTDEAMMVAIAYVWFTESLIDENFARSHTFGYDDFKSYVLGTADGIPKTPEWASKICRIDAEEIKCLAREWAAKPTFIIDSAGGANRRTNGIQWVRLVIALQAISGNIGRPGGGVCSIELTTRPSTMKSFGSIPGMKASIVNMIFHVYFRDAVLNPPVTWTSVGTDGKIYTYTYPKAGTPEIHLMAFSGGSGFTMNQNPGVPRHIEALQSPKIEFAYCQSPWWETAAKYSDVVLPVRYIGERDDIVQYDNLAVYMHTVGEPVPDARTDLDIYTAIAQRLGFGDQFTGGKTPAEWLSTLYSAGSVPMSLEEFKTAGYYEFPYPTQTPTVRLTGFHDDPDNNKLNTQSGKVEIYSTRVKDAFGADSPYVLAKYVPPIEGTSSPQYQTYPMLMLSPHPKIGRHSQWQNVAWVRAYEQMFRDGYRTVYMNPIDAEARGVKDRDIVRVFNARGAIVCSAYVTERIMPGVLYVWEGGWYQPEVPGDRQSTDIGGNVNVLIDPRPGELTHGMIANTLVEVEKWSG